MRRRKSLIVAGSLLALVMGGALLYDIHLGWRAEIDTTRDSIRSKTRVLEKQILLLSGRAQVESELVSLRETRKFENLKIVEGRTLAVAAATLQNTAKGILVSKGGAISSQRVDRPGTLGDFKVVSVIFDAEFPGTQALGEALYALESQIPWMVVRELDVRVKNLRDPRELAVKLSIEALSATSEFGVQSSELKK